MAVKTNITINIVEPGSDVPVPDTGLFTHGIGGTEATIILSVVLVLAIASIVLATYMYRKHKKQGRTTKLVHIIDQTKAVVKSKKRITIGLSIIALLVSACTFTAFMLNTNNSNTSAIEGNDTEQQTGNTEQTENTNNLTVNTESKELTIEVKDQPVFAVLPVQVTVEEATQAGYTLTAYTDNTDLVSTTNPNNKIPMVTVEGDELTSLQDNTWGLALDNEPTAKDNKVYKALSTDQTNPTIIKTIDDYSETPANDTTTIYYGFYITPDIPYGTYTGGEVEYEVAQNRTDLATVIFDGNGLYFNNDPGQTTNIVRYEAGSIDDVAQYSHTPNLNDNGEVVNSSNRMYPVDSNETFVYSFPKDDGISLNLLKTGSDSCGNDVNDYLSLWVGDHSEYTAKNDYNYGIKAFKNDTGKYIFGEYARNEGETISINSNTVTISYTTGPKDSGRGCGSGYGYYIEVTGYTNNSNIAGEYQVPITAEVKNYVFLGWSTERDATTAMYTSEDIVNPAVFNLVANERMVLYAIWSPIVSFNYNGNNATAGSMESTDKNNITAILANKDVLVGDVVTLYAPNYKKDGHGFVGWSDDWDAWSNLIDDDELNNPVIYGPNDSFTMTREMAMEIDSEGGERTFYSVWAPTEKDSSGSPMYLQDWRGCTNLAPTHYDSTTNRLSVKKNTITALTDNRDGNVYTIARLADGNCWMTENLRLDDSAIITAANTNSPYIVNGNVAIKNNNGSASNHLSPSVSSQWCDYQNSNCYNQSYLNTNNVGLGRDGLIASYNMTGDNIQWYSYGNYYNWYSATAGNGKYETVATNVVGDICPAGWSLPIGGETRANGSFSNLDSDMGGTGGYEWSSKASDRWRSFPNNFVYSGTFNGSSPVGRGETGIYWSSTGVERWNAHFLQLYENAIYPGNSSNPKSEGHSVRCVTLAE